MSIGSLLSIARTAMQVQQAAVSVAGHNIANAQTAGYSRQSVNTVARVAQQRPDGAIGTGVMINGVLRARDVLLDAQVRTSSSPAAGAGARRDLLTSIEGVLGSTGEHSLGGVLDQFYSAWSELASNPASTAAKANVRERGAALASAFNGIAGRLDVTATSAAESARAQIERVNSLARQIGELNVQIIAGDSISGSANDLKDDRDRMIDQLASIVNVTVMDRTNGSAAVYVGGIALVDGSDARQMGLLTGPTFQVTIAGSPDAMRIPDGTLGRTMQVINSDIPAVEASLDALAAGLVRDVNALHVTGWSPTAGSAGNWNPALGPTGSGITFFDATSASNLTARGIMLSAAVTASANAVASSDALNAPGNNVVALAISDQRRVSPGAVGGNFGTDLRTLVQDVAVKARDADDEATVQDILMRQAMERRSAATAVSTDEELTNLMKAQQAYIAASKLVNVADELAQSVLGMIR